MEEKIISVGWKTCFCIFTLYSFFYNFTLCLNGQLHQFFMKAKADHQTVMWTEDLDISPEFLYENSVKVK